MVYSTLKEAAVVFAENMVNKREHRISVNVMPDVIRDGCSSVLYEVCEADPRLILSIKTLQIQVENYGIWATLILNVEYTDNLCSLVVKVDSISDFREAAVFAAVLHRRELFIVYPDHMYEQIQDEKSSLLESHHMLNCYVSGLSTVTNRVENCSYMAQIIRFKYSCSYRELVVRKKEMTEKINEIVHHASLRGIEGWEKAYAVVKYCVENWNYGRVEEPKLEYTAYSAIVNNTAVCMGITLAVCIIFNELSIPCRYVHGIRKNGERHAWNLVFLLGGWFYIDVTDAIINKDPLYHWGMVHLTDRTTCERVTEPLTCNCTPEFIRKMIKKG